MPSVIDGCRHLGAASGTALDMATPCACFVLLGSGWHALALGHTLDHARCSFTWDDRQMIIDLGADAVRSEPMPLRAAMWRSANSAKVVAIALQSIH